MMGKAWVQELLDANLKSFQCAMWMPKHTFNKLVLILESCMLLAPLHLLLVAGQLMLFLYILGHCVTNMELQECFQIGAESALLYFHNVLEVLLAMYPDYVHLPDLAMIPCWIANNNKFYPMFKDT
ncbi:hypothetical protein GGF31_000837 [Allomyces arbusculus]|nr:hypothetical protein GGF31_000837 [Allomyces arbusculus]